MNFSFLRIKYLMDCLLIASLRHSFHCNGEHLTGYFWFPIRIKWIKINSKYLVPSQENTGLYKSRLITQIAWFHLWQSKPNHRSREGVRRKCLCNIVLSRVELDFLSSPALKETGSEPFWNIQLYIHISVLVPFFYFYSKSSGIFGTTRRRCPRITWLRNVELIWLINMK
jgi:hypothetical protein